MKILILLISLCLNMAAQDMRKNAMSSLFSDQKGSREGDAVTVLVVESSLAANQSETSAGKKSDIGFSASGNFDDASLGSIELGLNSKNSFNGSGTTKSSGVIKTKISATVDSVLNNGNLLIKGSKKITINGEEQVMSIKGIVRPADIMSDNSVLSYNISDAEIMFQGSGLIDNAQKPGWLTRFFHWLF
jgi:flagellar L-ring protein FlgH